MRATRRVKLLTEEDAKLYIAHGNWRLTPKEMMETYCLKEYDDYLGPGLWLLRKIDDDDEINAFGSSTTQVFAAQESAINTEAVGGDDVDMEDEGESDIEMDEEMVEMVHDDMDNSQELSLTQKDDDEVEEKQKAACSSEAALTIVPISTTVNIATPILDAQRDCESFHTLSPSRLENLSDSHGEADSHIDFDLSGHEYSLCDDQSDFEFNSSGKSSYKAKVLRRVVSPMRLAPLIPVSVTPAKQTPKKPLNVEVPLSSPMRQAAAIPALSSSIISPIIAESKKTSSKRRFSAIQNKKPLVLPDAPFEVEGDLTIEVARSITVPAAPYEDTTDLDLLPTKRPKPSKAPSWSSLSSGISNAMSNFKLPSFLPFTHDAIDAEDDFCCDKDLMNVSDSIPTDMEYELEKSPACDHQTHQRRRRASRSLDPNTPRRVTRSQTRKKLAAQGIKEENVVHCHPTLASPSRWQRWKSCGHMHSWWSPCCPEEHQ